MELTALTDRNGRVTNYADDGLGRLSQEQWGSTGQTVNTLAFTYNVASEVTPATHSYQANEAYNYDANGNRTNTGYSTGANNRLLSDGTFNYQYDAEGNRTRKTEFSTGDNKGDILL